MALATAGAYLKESSWSFSKYLQHYEAQWQAVDSLGLLEDYRTRTLHTTWDISLKSIRQESILAAEFLRFLAYLDPREFWYELFCRRLDRRNGRWPSWYELLHRSRDRRHRLWFTKLTESETSFETAMRTLVKYCLVQVNYQTGSYSIQVCVHDWTMHGLNRQISVDRYWLAFDFVAGYIKLETIDDLSAVQSRKIVPHAERLANERFKDVARRKAFQRPRLLEVSGLGELLLQHYRFGAAERMFAWALAGYKDKVGLDHTYTMIISYNLAKIYIRQDKYNQAEDLLQQALEFFNRAPDGENQRTLQVLSCLGVVYDLQGRVKEAEEIILQALQRKKIMLGIDDESTLHELNNLGVLYLKQMKLDQAAEMFEQARDGYERIPSTRVTAENKLAALGNLGLVYIDQKKLTEAEDIFRQVLQVREIALGAEHTETLNTINHLGYIYAKQGKFDQAEHLNLDVLQVKEKNLGVDHISTLETVSNLGYVYMQQGKSYQAEKMYERVLRGYEKNLGTDLVSTYVPAFDTSWVLGRIYAEMARPVESREMFQRALNGYQKVMGPSHEHCMRLENAIEALDRESPPQRPSMVQDTDPWKTVLIEDDDGQPAVD